MKQSKIALPKNLEFNQAIMQFKLRLKDVKQTFPLLCSRGLPRDLLGASNDILNIYGSCLSIRSDVEGLRPIKVEKQMQLRMLEAFLKDPFSTVGKTFVIYSKPNDDLAKSLGAYIMAKMYIQQMNSFGSVNADLNLPFWHIMGRKPIDEIIPSNRYGGEQPRPSGLIVSNILDEEPLNFQRNLMIRDVLENNAQATKVLVVTGSRDPITFVNTCLRIRVDGVILLSKAHTVTL